MLPIDNMKAAKTAGGQRTEEWLKLTGHSQEWLLTEMNRRRAARGFAGQLGRSNLWRWACGAQKPCIDNAAILAEITDDFVRMAIWAANEVKPPRGRRPKAWAANEVKPPRGRRPKAA